MNNIKQSSLQKHRTLILVAISVGLLVTLLCISFTAIFLFRNFNDAQQRSPEGAITEYFRAIQFKDSKQLESALCSEERTHAPEYINDFYSRLDDAEFELQTLSWIPSETIPDSGSTHIVTGKADITATRAGKSFNVQIEYRVTVKKDLLTWYVCNAEQTS